MTSIAGKRAVVTGGTGGICAAIVRALVGAGASVTAVSIDDAKLAGLAEQTGAETFRLDVSDRVAVMAALACREVDILVNCAGALGVTGTLYEQPAESATRLLMVNVLGVQNCLQAVTPGMLARDDGHIVNIGSVAGPYPSLGQPVYSATKAAVHSMSANLRMELYGSHVRVTEIRPGRVRTGMHAEMFDGDHATANARLYDPYECMEPEDVAEAVLWSLVRPARLCVTQLEIMSTHHVIGGVRFRPREEG